MDKNMAGSHLFEHFTPRKLTEETHTTSEASFGCEMHQLPSRRPVANDPIFRVSEFATSEGFNSKEESLPIEKTPQAEKSDRRHWRLRKSSKLRHLTPRKRDLGANSYSWRADLC